MSFRLLGSLLLTLATCSAPAGAAPDVEDSSDVVAAPAKEAAVPEAAPTVPQFSYMHAKVLVVDGAEAVVSTGNYADFRMKVERTYGVHDADPADVASLVTLFDADFSRKVPDLSCTRPWSMGRSRTPARSTSPGRRSRRTARSVSS